MGVLLSSSILETEYHIFHCEHYKTLTSTSDYLRQQLESDSHHMPEGTVIIASNQTAGHGRYGRKWVAPKGNLNMSFMLHTHSIPVETLSQLSFVLAIAVRNALHAISAEIMPQYKWPNDILIDDKKISGILLESSAPEEWVVLSVGINIESYPKDSIDYPATSIKEQIDKVVTIESLRDEVLAQFSQLFNQWRQFGFYPIRSLWLQYAKGIGKPIKVKTGDETLVGIFEDISDQGELLIREEGSDSVGSISSGDVFLG